MNIHQQVLNKFGNQAQYLKLIEEMAELTQAILKGTNVSEEIADVQIVLDQIKLLYPDWISWEQVKLKRLRERIGMWRKSIAEGGALNHRS